MKNLGKLQGIKLCKVECDFDTMYRDCYCSGWTVRGVATYKIGFKKYKTTFLIPENEYPQKVFFNLDCGSNPPEDRLQNEALLVLIYGEFQKYQGRMEMLNFFEQRRYKEEQERKRKAEEERKKQIALGEQISIEKYLLNL